VIGRLETPLLEPDAEEREGNVPNIVYSCGGELHNRELILPYSTADYASSLATRSLDEVLGAMVRELLTPRTMNSCSGRTSGGSRRPNVR
jgi:predicted GH43/DUF377 family glycosyl hydrolase